MSFFLSFLVLNSFFGFLSLGILGRPNFKAFQARTHKDASPTHPAAFLLSLPFHRHLVSLTLSFFLSRFASFG